MSKTPGRKPQSSPSRKRELSYDAKIMFALLKKQPLSKKEIYVETKKISSSAFYRNICLLEETKVIKQLEDRKYALWNFDYLEKIIEDAFIMLMNKTAFIGNIQIVDAVGKTWPEIQAVTYNIAHKLGLTISEKNGKTTFYKGTKKCNVDNNAQI